MNKIKGIRLIVFISFLTFIVTLFLYASTAFTQNDSDLGDKGSQLSKSVTNIAMKNDTTSSTSDINQSPDASSEGADEQIPYFNGQTNSKEDVISRGTTNRATYNKESQIEKPKAPAESPATRTEVKKVQVPQSTQPEVKRIQVPQSTQQNADSQSNNDVDLLARLITAEAQGEPYEAKVAVGAVVINRVKSGLWANTIKGVIYQNINGYYQFTPVVNGWINKPAESESIKAAEAAMNGVDPTNGAQFYYDDKATNAWILSKPVALQIGHMIYAY
ncbi:MAG: cell wall hydrolase [Aminipila sp.]